MSKRIAEWYIANRRKIMLVTLFIIIIVAISLIVKFLDKLETKNKENPDKENVMEETNKLGNFTDIYVDGSESVIGGEEITSSQITMLGIIEQFVQYCNDKKIDEAYNLISDECKDELYATKDTFLNNYYNKIFNGKKKNISVEYWTDNIYKVKFEDDALSTGIYTEENTIQDYISVIRSEDNEPKLNINNYIGRTDINKSVNSQNISIDVVRCDTYMDYQTYTYQIKNNTDDTILLDDKNSTDNMYLEDENAIQYTAYIHEISEAELTIAAGETKEITIKYYNKFGSTKNIESIVFNKIILNINENAVRETARIQIEL